MSHVLIVDDDPASAACLRDLVLNHGSSSIIVSSLAQARRQLLIQSADIVLAKLCLADGSCLELMPAIGPDQKTKMVVIAAKPSLETAIDALRCGVADYLVPPVNPGRLKSLLHCAAVTVGAGSELAQTRRTTPALLLGASCKMRSLIHQIDCVAPTEASVLLLGESGTGKELLAQTIHAKSLRHQQPILPVNCGAISPQLIESEIFGHEKGSFTGADRQHKGYFERACGGTLFLDEVIEMPIELQVKLLRVLETGTFMRIGSNQEFHTNVRIIAATNRDPEQAIAAGKLRLDLYHRLNVFPISIPPLRERGQDIALLAQHFLDELNQTNLTDKTLSPDSGSVLRGYAWPGNVRELRNFIQRAYILADQVIDASTFEISVSEPAIAPLSLSIPVGSSLAEVDKKLIFATLAFCDGVKKRTADMLGISLKTLYNRLEEYGPDGKKPVPSELLVRPVPAMVMPGSFMN